MSSHNFHRIVKVDDCTINHNHDYFTLTMRFVDDRKTPHNFTFFLENYVDKAKIADAFESLAISLRKLDS